MTLKASADWMRVLLSIAAEPNFTIDKSYVSDTYTLYVITNLKSNEQIHICSSASGVSIQKVMSKAGHSIPFGYQYIFETGSHEGKWLLEYLGTNALSASRLGEDLSRFLADGLQS